MGVARIGVMIPAFNSQSQSLCHGVPLSLDYVQFFCKSLEMKINALTDLDNPQKFAAKWEKLSVDRKLKFLRDSPFIFATRIFLSLPHYEQIELMQKMSGVDRLRWLNQLPPDEIADVLQKLTVSDRQSWLALVPERIRSEIVALMAYGEDVAGGLMTPHFIRVRPEMHIEEAIHYVRHQIAQFKQTIFYAFVLDGQQHLIGVASFRELLSSTDDKLVSEIMLKNIVSVHDDTPQTEIAKLFRNSSFLAIPVVDSENRMKGIVTVDDVVDVVEEEATKDIQRMAGTEALDGPYLHVSFFEMFRKRVVWLAILFVGEMFTATAMGYYEHEIARAVVLALFIPLIISSGGNSGSQASTLVVRALALGEVRLVNWWHVLYRELGMGMALGSVLGAMGFARILLWPSALTLYGEFYVRVAMAVGLSIVGIIMWGTLIGAALPLVLRSFRLDPATACAPFVATIVDVSGLVIYFTVAQFILKGTVL